MSVQRAGLQAIRPFKVSGCTTNQLIPCDPELGKVEVECGPLLVPDKSMNDGIQGDLCLLTYMMVADVVEVIATQGLLAKVDIRNMYRIIPVHPEDHWLLGMLWEESVFVDRYSTIMRPPLTPQDF